MIFFIRVLNGVAAGYEFVLDQHEVICGRNGKSDFKIADSNVSRRHCRFVAAKNGSQYLLEDLGSANGTFVNNTSVRTQILGVGDRIRIGNTLLEFATKDDLSDSSLGQDVASGEDADTKIMARPKFGAAEPAADRKHTTDQLVSAVSHRINNLLQLGNGGEFLVDMGLESSDLERVAQGWSTVRRSQNRISRLSVNLSTYCHEFKPLLRKLKLRDLVEAAVSQIGNGYDETRLKIVHQTAADFELELDERYCDRAIENVLCVGLMASEAGDDGQDEVTLETSMDDQGVLIRVGFRHFDDRFDLAQLMEVDEEIDKIKGEMGLLEMLVSRKIVEGQAGTISGFCEQENLNWIEVRFPVG